MCTNFNENCCIAYIQGHLNYIHSIVATFSPTEHQSCQEPETHSVGHFFPKNF